jgi:hypothetical protein
MTIISNTIRSVTVKSGKQVLYKCRSIAQRRHKTKRTSHRPPVQRVQSDGFNKDDAFHSNGVRLHLKEAVEVNIVECDPESKAFDSQLTVMLSLYSNITQSEATDFDSFANQLTAVVKSSYNTLKKDYCDPFSRRIVDLTY